MGGLLLVSFTVYLIGLVGWLRTWGVLGLILILVLPQAFFLLKDDPAEMGLRPDGAPQPLNEGQAGPARPGPLEVESWRDSFRSRPMWQLCGGYFVCGCSIALVSPAAPTAPPAHHPSRAGPAAAVWRPGAGGARRPPLARW